MADAAERRETTREAIIEAAVVCFAQEGYRRTAMDRIAKQAGISRAALYLHFSNKEALFRALIERLHEESLADAERALLTGADLSARVSGVLKARSVRFFEALRDSVHAEEFLGENSRLCGDVAVRAHEQYGRALKKVLAEADAAGEISLKPTGLKPAQAAEVLLDMADGIKERARVSMTTPEYTQRLEQTVGVVLVGYGLRRIPG